MRLKVVAAVLCVLSLASCGGMLNRLSDASDKAQKTLTQNQQGMVDLMRNAGEMFGALKQITDGLKGLDLPKIVSLMAQLPSIEKDLADARAELKAAAPEAYAKADKNGDGKLSPSELIAYLLAGGTTAFAAVSKLLNNTSKRMQDQHDEHYDELAALKQQLALIQQAKP